MAIQWDDNFDTINTGGISLADPMVHTPGSNTFDMIITEANNTVNARDRRMSNPTHLKRLTETAKFLNGVFSGKIPLYRLQEVLSTSDFTYLFGDIVDRQMLITYAEIPNVWSAVAKRGTVRDFRASRRIAVDGLETPFYPTFKKAELEGVKYDNNISETAYTTQVDVYERGIAFNWRMFINDDLDVMSSLPQRLARGARRTEEKMYVTLFVGSGGYNTTFFSNANKNIVNTANGASSNNPALSVQGLRDALTVMALQVDAQANPIYIEGMVLEVPPMLEITAREILTATQLEVVPATSALGTRYVTANYLASKIKLVVNPYLTTIDQSANKHTTWYLFADPTSGRPALEMSFLRGYEQPMILQKAPNTLRVGGSVDPMLGDFNDMSIHYKGVHILGGTLLDPKMAVVSNGSGA